MAEGLAAARFASASIDVSDGFLRDLGHLCEQSRCGATVEVSQLPLGPAALRALVPDIARNDVYLCGPDAWTSAAIAAARSCGVPPERIHLERFTW